LRHLLHYAKPVFAFRDDSYVTAAGDKAKALADLRLAIDALRPHLSAPDEQAALFLIEQSAAGLTSAPTAKAVGLAEFDPSRLSHLLQITGPDLAVELIARLTEDLTATQDKLIQGSSTQDWKALRESSHVLISLSGSVGAVSLQTMAENLNAIAHRLDRDAVDTLLPVLEAELASLIQLIRHTRPSTGGAG
jgi:HPt (histidine-containing phosphotransfer) domain-containing protein